MKFLLNRVSDFKVFGTIEINSLDELKQLNDKYNNKEEGAWPYSHSIVIDFSTTKDDQRQGIDGTITIYDDYIELLINKQQKIEYVIKIMGNAAKCLRLGDLDKAICILIAESLETAIRQINDG